MTEKKKTSYSQKDKDVITSIKTLAELVESQQQQINSILAILNRNTEITGLANENGASNEPEYPDHLRSHNDDRARSKLVDLCFNTPVEKLPELTETPRMQVTPTAYVEAMNEFINNMRQGKKYEPLDTIYIRRKDMRMQSVSRKSRWELIAFSQIEQEKEQLSESQQGEF